ncbi:hypothetical protein [Streptomyces chilikensis]|uniref:hypothetical protein n=1 Tax=Streptomyces chilikensis TaxID=1194079 RepID=UPI001409046E|nr:hypothetical protein [Streptomyces chilikensis]
MAEARGGRAWRVAPTALAVAAGCAVLSGAWLVWAVAGALDDPAREAPCAEALAFGGGTLPPGATDARCTVQRGIDTHHRADFRMPRAEVADRAARNRPDLRMRTGVCGPQSVAACGSTDGTGGQAHALDIAVTHEDAVTARVSVEAFTV